MNKIVKWVLIVLGIIVALFGFMFVMSSMVMFHYGTPTFRPKNS